MTPPRSSPPVRRVLDTLLEFLLQAWAIGRIRWYVKLALVLVTGGLAVVRTNWIAALVSSAWQLAFGESIVLPELSPTYGLLLIFSGVAVAVWGALRYEPLPSSKESPDRLALLDTLARESLARCKSRLSVSMASRDRIPAIVATFDELPDLAESVAIPAAGCVSILTGPLGSGKSFAAERLFRAAVLRARDPRTRLPIYITARHLTDDLKTYSTRALSPLGDLPSPVPLSLLTIWMTCPSLTHADCMKKVTLLLTFGRTPEYYSWHEPSNG